MMFISEELEKYLQDVLLKLEQTAADEQMIAWIIKKGRKHPRQVAEMMSELLKNKEVISQINLLGLDYDYAVQTAEAIALLHDTGRLSEVDLQSGKFMRAEQMSGYSHEIESYKLAQKLGIDDINILLPVKYHDAFCIDEKIEADPVYQNLNSKQKQQLMLFSYLIQDADRMANLKTYARSGIKGTSETLDPVYTAKAQVSKEVKDAILDGKIPQKATEHTYIDALLRFLALSFCFHFGATRQIFNDKVADEIFAHVLREIKENAVCASEKKQAEADAFEAFAFIRKKSVQPC